MGSPTIFAGKYTKLLTQKGLMQKGGAVNQFDGDRNYILNSTFENGTDDGWNRVKTTITNNLPTGTPTIGKTVGTAPSISSFGPYFGSAPFDSCALFFGNVLGTVVAGEGVISDAFTVEPGDLGKVLTFKLYYKSDFGASTDNWSGVLGSQTWAVYIYDQTAGAWLQPAGFLGMNQNSGVGLVSGTFQSSVVSGQQYRIAVIALKNTTTNSALQIDNVYVGPQTAPIGPVVTDWADYTPTITYASGSPNITWTGRFRRVGDSIELDLRGQYVSGAFNGPRIALPFGLTIDSSKLQNGANGYNLVGYGSAEDAATANYQLTVTYPGANYLVLDAYNASLNYTVNAGLTNTLPFTFGANDTIRARAFVPVVGWSSNVQLSNDTDTRVVALQINTTQTPAVNNTGPTIIYENVLKDTHGGYNASTGAYKIPVSGIYRISGSLQDQAKVRTLNSNFTISIFKNGSFFKLLALECAPSTSSYQMFIAGSTTAELAAGDILTFKSFADTSNNLSSTAANKIELERLSGPSVVAASETVACSYSAIGTQVNIPNNSVTTITACTTKLIDTHNSFSSGVFTAPISGTYLVNAGIQFGVNGTGQRVLYIVGSNNTIVAAYISANTTIASQLNGSGIVTLDAGQTVRVQALQNSGGLLANTVDGAATYVSVVRVGNK